MAAVAESFTAVAAEDLTRAVVAAGIGNRQFRYVSGRS
jgi:hypothetical protein